MATDPDVVSLIDQAEKVDANLGVLRAQISQNADAVRSKDADLQQARVQISAQQEQIQSLTNGVSLSNQVLQSLAGKLAKDDSTFLDLLTGRAAPTILAGLHKLPAKTTDSREAPGVWIDSGGHTSQTNPTTSGIPHGTFTWAQGSDSQPARIVFTPAAGWDNIFVYERFALPAHLPRYVSDIRSFSMSLADRAAANCIEWQQEFTWKGNVYNLGWQWNLTAKLFRYFDFTNKAWKPTTIPFIDVTAIPTNIVTEHILDESKATTTHVAISINGNRYPVGVVQPATPRSGAGDKYTISILQLDSQSKGSPFGCNIHNCEARYF